MRANYHTHTPRCGHALGKDAFEYAKAAFEANVEILGFSDHAPFPDKDLGCRMQYDELDLYFNEVDEIKALYEGKMKVYKGLEIEFIDDYTKSGNNFYEHLLNDKKCDYLLLGQHFFKCSAGKLVNMYNLDSLDQIVDYAVDCARAMETGYFDILAHPDLFGVNQFRWNSICDKATDIIIDAAVKTNTIIEFNANGFRRGIEEYDGVLRYKYPLDNFWNKVKGSGARVIIGSDSHNPKEIIDSATSLAEDYLRVLNIDPIDEFI